MVVKINLSATSSAFSRNNDYDTVIYFNLLSASLQQLIKHIYISMHIWIYI